MQCWRPVARHGANVCSTRDVVIYDIDLRPHPRRLAKSVNVAGDIKRYDPAVNQKATSERPPLLASLWLFKCCFEIKPKELREQLISLA